MKASLGFNSINKMRVSSTSGVRRASSSAASSRATRTTARQTPGGLSPRSYQARVDLCRLWELMTQGRSQADIARMMKKDPAWVSRNVRRIELDFSAVFQRPSEKLMVNEQLARFESLYAKAVQVAEDSEGMAQVAALRTANTILREKMAFMQFVGLVNKDQENPSQILTLQGFYGS